MRRAETMVRRFDLCDLGESFGPPTNGSEKQSAIFVCATVARRQSDGTVKLAIGSIPMPVKVRSQYAERVVGFADALAKASLSDR